VESVTAFYSTVLWDWSRFSRLLRYRFSRYFAGRAAAGWGYLGVSMLVMNDSGRDAIRQ